MDLRLPGLEPPGPPALTYRWARLTVTMGNDGRPLVAEVDLVSFNGLQPFHRAMSRMPDADGSADVLGELLACADRLVRDA